MSGELDARAMRLLARLATRGAVILRDEEGRPRLETAVRSSKEVAFDEQVIVILLGRGLLTETSSGRLVINSTGAAMVRRSRAAADAFAGQHQERRQVILEDRDLGRRPVTVNHDESPLAWLRRRKDRDGRPMIDAHQFAAGERLRSDYERGHLMPRVTANWNAAVAAGRRSGGNASADLTESALGARRRVEGAIAVLEPEMASLAIDFCCFLKGLEEIERERQWPARSAKVVLRLALTALARHYGLATRATGPAKAGKTRHWGAEGYRPAIDGGS